MDWFKWIQYSKFNIYFARADTLPQMVDRLSKYQYPIDLRLTKHIDVSTEDIIYNLSKLTQLRSFTSGGDTSSYIPSDWFYPLTVLTNLEALVIHNCECPLSFLHYFPRIRKANFAGKEDFEQVLTICKNIEYAYGILDNYLDALPITVKKLKLNSSPNTQWIKLTKLTNLKKLTSFDEHNIDLTGITWIENLTAGKANIKGLEFCNHLTRLLIYTEDEYRVPALPNLEKLHLNVLDYDGTHMANMTRLTHLKIHSKHADLTTLSTSLQYLELLVTKHHDLMDMIHLTRLTYLNFKTYGYGRDLGPINNLTNLEALHCDSDSDSTLELSSLQNLTYLFLFRVQFDGLALRNLTKLQSLELLDSYNTELWNSLSYLTNLTVLQVYKEDVPKVNCTVIGKLPLKELNLDMPKKNEAAVVANLTQLDSVHMEVSDDDEILALTALKNLTRLAVSRNSSKVTGIHLTSLTSLQKLNVKFKSVLTETDLKPKLTRLFDLYLEEYDDEDNDQGSVEEE